MVWDEDVKMTPRRKIYMAASLFERVFDADFAIESVSTGKAEIAIKGVAGNG